MTGAAGSYVEYAFGTEDGRTICGVWWDLDNIDGAFYIETLCEAGIAGNWDAAAGPLAPQQLTVTPAGAPVELSRSIDVSETS